MVDATQQDKAHNSSHKDEDINPVSHQHFSSEIKKLIDEAEDIRLARMREYEKRGFLSFSLGLFSVLAGACAFGWFFFVRLDLLLGILGLIAGVIPSYLLHQYKMRPLQQYERQHKMVFMPKLAKALGNLKYRPKSGIKIKMLGPARILPSFENYHAEDCLSGTYKGTKLILSEARMTHRKQAGHLVFDGVFILLQLSEERFTGQTIITADRHSAKRWQGKRWKDLQSFTVENGDLARIFDVYTDTPKEAENFAREEILERLKEISTEFDKSPLSISFYKKKYIFIMIPYDVDMFEPSNLYLPITTSSNAHRCKKEVDQILAIIDMLALYEPNVAKDKSLHLYT